MIDVTDDGINNLVNDLHSKKQFFPINFNEDGISNSIFDNNEHPLKASFRIETIEEGIVICVNDEHFLKAIFPIKATEEGISNVI